MRVRADRRHSQCCVALCAYCSVGTAALDLQLKLGRTLRYSTAPSDLQPRGSQDFEQLDFALFANIPSAEKAVCESHR